MPLSLRTSSALFCAVTFAGALLGSQTARATPTGDPFPGPTGLGVIPTTQTVDPGQVEASLNYEHVAISGGGGHADQQPFANLTYGFENGEVGASYLRQKTVNPGFTSTISTFALHGKYRVYTTPDEKGALAIGAHYYDFGRFDGASNGNVISLYATASYEFRKDDDRPMGRLHLGVLGQRSHFPGKNTTYARPFVGGEAFVTPDVSIGADYLASNGDVGQGYTLSARYIPVKQSYSAQIGIGKLRNDTKYFVGISYAFGGK